MQCDRQLTTGALLYTLSRLGVIRVRLSLGLCYVFAALISPTDPVATLSVLREVNAPPILKNCIFGTSPTSPHISPYLPTPPILKSCIFGTALYSTHALQPSPLPAPAPCPPSPPNPLTRGTCYAGEATLNDALSIVLFNVIRHHAGTLSDSETIVETLGDIAVELLWTTFGSVLTGCGFALGAAYCTRRLRLLAAAVPEGAGFGEVPHATAQTLPALKHCPACVHSSHGRVPIVCGAGASCRARSVDDARDAHVHRL